MNLPKRLIRNSDSSIVPRPDCEVESASETPIELQRFGPPPFRRPTLEEFEDAMIDSIDQMTKEEIEEELREAGIDMAPAIAKLHAMIEAKKAQHKT